MMKRLVLLLVICVCAGAIAQATTFALGGASTAGFFQGTLNGDAARGWDFSVNANDVYVTSFAINPYLSGPTKVTLWDVSSPSELAQLTINAVGGSWTSANLATPVALVNGNEYAIIGWAAPQNDSWYQFQFGPPSGFAPTGTIQYIDTRFGNFIDENTFPTSSLTGYIYGVPDIGYQIGAPVPAVPEPAGLTLVGSALLGLATLRRRFK